MGESKPKQHARGAAVIAFLEVVIDRLAVTADGLLMDMKQTGFVAGLKQEVDPSDQLPRLHVVTGEASECLRMGAFQCRGGPAVQASALDDP